MSFSELSPSGDSRIRRPDGCDATNSRSPDTGLIVGKRLRPHCSHEAMVTPRQCARRRSARSAERRTTLRVVAKGCTTFTPSSVAFWMAKSMRSPEEMPSASVIINGDSRSISLQVFNFTLARSRPTHSNSALHSPPMPSNRVTASPSCRRSAAT